MASSVAIPSSNTGSSDTGAPTVPLAGWGVDWLEYTIKADNTPETAYLSQRDFWAPMAKGKFNYHFGATTLEGAIVLWGGQAGQGTHVAVPGGALRQLGMVMGREQHAPGLGRQAWTAEQLLASVTAMNAPTAVDCTRVDIAFDTYDFTNLQTLLLLGDDRGWLTRTARGPLTFIAATGDAARGTVYVGSPSADTRVRVYDKRQELIVKGKENMLDLPQTYTRVEYQFRGDAAARIGKYISEGRWQEVRGACKRVLAVRSPSADSNRARWPLHPSWAALLGDTAPPTRVATPAPRPALEDARAWLLKSAAPWLAAVLEADGDGGAFITHMVEIGRAAMKDRHERAVREVQRARASSGA